MRFDKNYIRYVLIGLHLLFWLIALAASYATTTNIYLLAFHICLGVGELVYCPAAIWMAIVDSPSRFTQAGGEVGYLVVMQVYWFSSACTAAFFGNKAVCNSSSAVVKDWLDNWVTTTSAGQNCSGYAGPAALGFIQFFMLIGWMGWVIHTARTVPGMSSSEAFKIPTHQLLRGTFAGSGNGSGKKRGMVKGELEKGAGNAGPEGVGLVDYRQGNYGPVGMSNQNASQSLSTLGLGYDKPQYHQYPQPSPPAPAQAAQSQGAQVQHRYDQYNPYDQNRYNVPADHAVIGNYHNASRGRNGAGSATPPTPSQQSLYSQNTGLAANAARADHRRSSSPAPAGARRQSQQQQQYDRPPVQHVRAHSYSTITPVQPYPQQQHHHQSVFVEEGQMMPPSGQHFNQGPGSRRGSLAGSERLRIKTDGSV